MTPPRSVEAWAACGEHGGCDVFSPDCPYCRDNRRNFIDYAAEQVAQARAEEREACAKVANDEQAHSESMIKTALNDAQARRWEHGAGNAQTIAAPTPG